MELNSFILGVDEFPVWFNEECKKGRVKINNNPDTGVMENVVISNPTRKIICSKGDKIVKIRTGLSCVPKSKIKKEEDKNSVKENKEK